MDSSLCVVCFGNDDQTCGIKYDQVANSWSQYIRPFVWGMVYTCPPMLYSWVNELWSILGSASFWILTSTKCSSRNHQNQQLRRIALGFWRVRTFQIACFLLLKSPLERPRPPCWSRWSTWAVQSWRAGANRWSACRSASRTAVDGGGFLGIKGKIRG